MTIKIKPILNNNTLFNCIADDFSAHIQNRKGLSGGVTTVLASRGFHTLFLYRLQRFSLKLPFIGKVLAKVLWYLSCVLNGCDISYHSKLEGGVFIPHPVGIVIGDNVEVKKGTTILQNVTLGTKNGGRDEVPFIGSKVYLGAGCQILGAVNIGANSIIGANSVVITDIPENSTAVGVPARIIRS